MSYVFAACDVKSVLVIRINRTASSTTIALVAAASGTLKLKAAYSQVAPAHSSKRAATVERNAISRTSGGMSGFEGRTEREGEI